jgi:hypothetical protein
MERIYRSGEVDSLLPAALALVSAMHFLNSTLTTLVNKEYGAATTGIVTSFEIIFTWLAAVVIFHVCDLLHLQTLASLGARPHASTPTSALQTKWPAGICPGDSLTQMPLD